MNEQTFVARLGAETRLRAEQRRASGLSVLIAQGDVEERQVDLATGRITRCDIRLIGTSGRKLVSGEMKRPEVPSGRDPRNQGLVADARRKAVSRGLSYYFTCNMAEIVLFSVGVTPTAIDREEAAFALAPITHSRQVQANWGEIVANWNTFLDDLECRLQAIASTRPQATAGDVLVLRRAIFAVVDEAIGRVISGVRGNLGLADEARQEAAKTFGFRVDLNPADASPFRDELLQLLRLGVFVIAQKLVLYRVLAESGRHRRPPFILDPLEVPRRSTNPALVRNALDQATAHAIARSGDYQTAFAPTPHSKLVFLPPSTPAEVEACRVGEAWDGLLSAVNAASWTAINQNLVGMLYEVIVDPEYRHQLGQHYTQEDVVDLLTTFAVREAGDVVLDPASGGGSFVRAAYRRKRDLGATHEETLATTWAFDIAAFAAELTTISLATGDTSEPAAYPRVLLCDFFGIRPGQPTTLQIPDLAGRLAIPETFDAVIGNPPYISYRNQTNQTQVLRALTKRARSVTFPQFSGKSDEYVWFIAHATSYLRPGARLAFVVSSGILFADYGIPLIRFLGRHFRIRAVIDSIVERWFVDADVNTVLLCLEREEVAAKRSGNMIRFVRFRHPLARLLPAPDSAARRQALEDILGDLLEAPAGGDDPRYSVRHMPQGDEGGLVAESGGGAAEESPFLGESEAWTEEYDRE